MKNQNQRNYGSFSFDWKKYFPWDQYPKVYVNQQKAFEIIAGQKGSVSLELPTGTGKTAVGYTALKALRDLINGPLFYIVPTKQLIDQVVRFHPDARPVYGRNEHKCLFYTKRNVTAEEAPCSMLNCPHRVDQETGLIKEDGAAPCPYLQGKFLARQDGINICTTSFYLFSHLFSGSWEVPAGLVIDECHRIASTVRNSLSYEVSDYHLERGIKFLEKIGASEAQKLKGFLEEMIRIVKPKISKGPALLEANEIHNLLARLQTINKSELRRSIKDIVAQDADDQAEILKRMESIVFDLSRYYSSLEYSLTSASHPALNYTYGFCSKESGGRGKYKLCIKAYHVAPLVRKILSPFTIAYSATIGDPKVFGFETGIDFPFFSLQSDFPSKNTRIFMPTDTANLAMKSRGHSEPTKSLRKIAKACFLFASKKIRSLVIVVSNTERDKFVELAKEENVNVVSYGNGVTSRAAAQRFIDGEGEVLVGTSANFGEGLDLPNRIAPVIFFLRPDYPNPNDPGTVFEERRFGGRRWALWNWRVIIGALQGRGRNIRGSEDVGVTIFVSQQFRRFLLSSLPEWLEDAYDGKHELDACIQETLNLLA